VTRLLAAGLAVLTLAACGGSSAPAAGASPSPCAPASPGLRVASLRGTGTATTTNTTTCGRWAADLDWTCSSATGYVETTLIRARGEQQPGPRGDGLAGMNIRHFDSGATFRFRVAADPGCAWSIDVIQD